VGHHADAEAEAHGDGKDDAVAARVEVRLGGHLEARDKHVAEEEGGHAADDTVGDGGDDARHLGEDAHEQKPDATGDARTAGGALGEGDDAVVLREGGVGHAGADGGEEGADAVGEEAALDGLVVLLRVSGLLGSVVRRADVADGLDGGDEESHQHRENRGAVEPELERFDPQESHRVGALNLGVDNVVPALVADALLGDAGDEVAEEEGDEDVAVLHEGRAEELDDDEEENDGEAEADHLRGAEGEDDVARLAACLEGEAAAARHAARGGGCARDGGDADEAGLVIGAVVFSGDLHLGEEAADEGVRVPVVLPRHLGAHRAAAPTSCRCR